MTVERSQRALELAQRLRVTLAEQPARTEALPADRREGVRVVPVDRAALRDRRVIFPEDLGAAAHAYRMLRTQLLRRTRAERLRLIGVVSAADGEGKTLTALNLALSVAAEPNQSALLMELDLRRPALARLLGVKVERGVEAWFEGGIALSELLVELEGIERLRLLPALNPVPGSSDLLAGARAADLLAEVRGRYPDGLVIVDLPPALLTDDVLTIAPSLDGLLLVVSERVTLREDVLRLTELIGPGRFLGTVLNSSSESERRTY